MRRWALVVLAAIWPSLVPAADLGVVGPTYTITEQDAIEAITARAKEMERSGELARMRAEHQRQAMERMEHPKPVRGITQSRAAATHYIDPTWTLDRDIRDDTGKLLFPRGTKVNPLDYVTWNSRLLFIDGSDEQQVKLAIRHLNEPRRVKVVLVNGSPTELMRKLKKRIYFDQGGALTRQLRISAVPALVGQEGKRLRIDVLPSS